MKNFISNRYTKNIFLILRISFLCSCGEEESSHTGSEQSSANTTKPENGKTVDRTSYTVSGDKNFSKNLQAEPPRSTKGDASNNVNPIATLSKADKHTQKIKITLNNLAKELNNLAKAKTPK